MKKIVLITCLLLSLNLVAFIFLIENKEATCNKPHIDEWTPARDPVTKCDSSLIESSNFFVEENIKLENYIKELETENKRFSSMLAEIENEKGGHEILKKLWNK